MFSLLKIKSIPGPSTLWRVLISLNVLEPSGNSHSIYAAALIFYLFIIIRGIMFYLITMDLICVNDSVNFIRCYVIFFLNGLDHTKNIVSHAIAFKRCQIDIQGLFFWKFWYCWYYLLRYRFAFSKFWVVRYGPVFVPSAPVPSKPVPLFFLDSPDFEAIFTMSYHHW